MRDDGASAHDGYIPGSRRVSLVSYLHFAPVECRHQAGQKLEQENIRIS